jgi:hypothetical protein
VSQGAYHPAGRILLATLLAAATAVALRGRHRPRWSWPLPWVCFAVAVAISVWTVTVAALHGSIGGSVPVIATVGGFVAAAVIVRCSDATQRELCAVAMVGVGALVGLSGWIGVAWHWQNWASPVLGVWRASSTLTYANAAAAILAGSSLLAVALLIERPASVSRVTALHLTLVGLGATLSRGGVLAFAAGVATLSMLAGVRVVWQRVSPSRWTPPVAAGPCARPSTW